MRGDGATIPAGGWLGVVPALVAIAGLLLLPLAVLVTISFGSADGVLAPYAKIATSPAYLRPLWNTFFIALCVTALSILCAYPLAWLMATAGPRTRKVLVFVVLLPFWTSALVRTTAWIVLLQRKGIVNVALEGAGITNAPIAFVFNFSGVMIGMVHVLMPFLVFPLYAAFRAIDRNLVLAAEGLGAGGGTIARRVILPLTAPGLCAGAMIVFMSAIGYYITPALMGGPGQTMITMMINYHLRERLDWEMAAALSVTLLLATIVLFVMFQRLVGLERLWGGGEGVGSLIDTIGSGARTRRSPAGWLVALAGVLVGGFLIAPILLVFPMSVANSPFLAFPPPSYSWRWFTQLASDQRWLDALLNSIKVALVAVPLATAAGSLAALGSAAVGARWRTAVEVVLVLPMVLPAMVVAVGLYYVYAPLGLVGTTFGLGLGHALLGLPFVFITVRASLRSFDPNLAMAAYGLGASWPVMVRRVLLPHLLPGIAAGALFSFITSFDDVIIALFVADIRIRTLPKLMYEGVVHDINPAITAVAVLLILFSVVVLGASLAMSRRRA